MAAGQFLDLADQVITVPRFFGDQVQQHQLEFAAPEHPCTSLALHPFKGGLRKGPGEFLGGRSTVPTAPASSGSEFHSMSHFEIFLYI